MEEMSTVEEQIADKARKHPGEALTNLHSYIDQTLLLDCFNGLNKKGAVGVDGQTWYGYNEQIGEQLPKLLGAFKSGRYRAPYIRRTYIPKGDGKMRPLGLPTVYEQMFKECSYGFRPGRSQHQALDKLFREVSFGKKRYVIDADMKNYFGSIDHQRLRKFLDLRIKDGVIRKQIDKWLKAGILEEEQLTYPKEGTPQGGTISPLLSNIYLHYVLDEWFTEQIQPLLEGKSSIIRFADDFLLCFTKKEDAKRVMKVLPKRLAKHGLTLHPEKTRLIELAPDEGNKGGTFDFLGFTHYLGRSRKGKAVLKRKTSKKKFRKACVGMNDWLRKNRHMPVKELIGKVNKKLRGYYNYYGITFNSVSIGLYYERVKHMLRKWLNRRGGKPVWNWERYTCLVEEWIPLEKPGIKHSYLLAKP